MTLALVAQSTDIPGNFAAWLIGTPVTVLAFITWAWLTGRIVSGDTYRRCLAEKDAAEAELRRRAQDDRDVLIPAVVRATDVLAHYVERKLGDTPPPPTRRP